MCSRKVVPTPLVAKIWLASDPPLGGRLPYEGHCCSCWVSATKSEARGRKERGSGLAFEGEACGYALRAHFFTWPQEGCKQTWGASSLFGPQQAAETLPSHLRWKQARMQYQTHGPFRQVLHWCCLLHSCVTSARLKGALMTILGSTH